MPPERDEEQDTPTRRDRELIFAFSGGSFDAFCELYDRHSAAAFEAALAACPDSDVAHEAVDDAFLALWAARTVHPPEIGTVGEWLCTTARRNAIELGRARRLDAYRSTASRRLHARPDPGPDARLALSQAKARREPIRRIGSLLDGLPAVQRQAIALAFYAGMTNREIADHLGIPIDLVRTRVRIGLEMIIEQGERADP